MYPVVYQVSIVFIPDFLLFAALAGWAITQVLTLYAAKWVIGKAKEESQTQKDEVVDHFDEQLEGVQTSLTGQLEDFEGRFSVAYSKDLGVLQTDMDKIPQRIAMTFNSEKGAEVRALQGYLDKEGVEIDQAMEIAEAQFVQDNPQAFAAMALKKAYDADVSEKYRKENPIKAGMWDFAKAAVLPQFEQAFMGTSNLPTKRKGNATNPYGL